VPPQEVWRKLAPYQSTRLPTSLTHSEERIWRHYAGLSDHPHFDAYRVCAPAADAWQRYDRWGGEKIRWAAPLETIGDLTRSLRELNRPGPIAAWAQGPHHGWGPAGGRTRSSPTPDELRLQAWHALSARITSLYWFNLGIKSVVKFRDLIDPITRVDREALVLAPLLLEGAAGRHERRRAADGRPDWDLATVCGPSGAIFFALDLDYRPDPVTKTFVLGPPRAAAWRFPLPGYLGDVADVFRIDADGISDATWRKDGEAIMIDGRAAGVAVHVATADATLRGRLEAERRRLVAAEAATGFDPARDDVDFAALAGLLEERGNPPAAGAAAPLVQVVTSTVDGSQRLSPGDDLPLGPVAETPAAVIRIDPQVRDQSVLGLGGSFDHATCENLAKLPDDRRREVIASLFDPERGIGMNLMRVCIGTSDFTGVPYYTYDDMPEGETDPDLARFSIEKDRAHVLPAIHLARAANPDLLLFGSPWSPPAWMKTTGRLGTGSVAREWYPAYARYLLAFIRAYEAEGLPIHAITIQNEPRMAHPRYPTTLWTAEEQRDFIRDHLGPLFEREEVKTLIWCWDHNWNLPEFPRTILADPAAARFVDGTAFHHYEGRIEAQSALHREFPQKHVYFTEGSVFGVRGAAGLIDILRNSSRSYSAWVMMLDEHRRPNRGPHSASATCIELLDDGTVRTNFDYYMYGQFMKFIRRGAVRVESSEPAGAPRNVAFLDPDGEIVLVAANTARSPVTFAVACGGRMFSASLPARAVSTYRWPAAP
jgi:O-glycosyl hydrolase